MFSLQFFKNSIIPACNILAFYISYNEFKDRIIFILIPLFLFDRLSSNRRRQRIKYILCIGGYHLIADANFRFFSLLVFMRNGQKTWFKICLRDLFLLRICILAKENSRHRSCFAVAGQHVGQLVESGACVAYIVEQKHMLRI